MLKPCAEHVNILFSIPPTTVMQKTTRKSEPIKNQYTNCNLSSTQNIIKRIEEPFSIKSFQNAEKTIKNEDYLKKSRYANSFGTKNNLVLDLSSRPASPCFSVDSAIDLSHDLLSNPGSSKSFDQDSITNENIDFVKTSVFFDQNTTDSKNIAKPVEVGIDLNMNSYSSSLLSFKKPDLNSGSEFSLKNNSTSEKGSMTSSNHINLADKLDLKKSVISSANVYPTKRLLIEEAKNAIVIVENIEVNDTKSKISLDNRKNNDFPDSIHSFNDYEEQNESGLNSSSILFPRNKDRLSKIKQNETTPKKKKRFLKNIIDMKRKQLNPKENELSNEMEVRTYQDSHGRSSSEVSSPSKVTTAISSIVPITTDTIESTILQLNQKSNISSESDDIIEKDEKQGKTSDDVSSESEDNGPPQRSVQKQKKNRDDFPDSNCSSVHDPPLSSSIPSDSDANFTRLISLTVKDVVQEGVESKRKHKRRTSQLRELTRLLSDDESNSSAGEHQPPQEFTQNLSTFTDLISKKLKQKKTKQEKREKGQVTRTNQDIQQQNSTAPLKHSHVNSTADVPKSVKKSSRGPNEKTADRPASSNSPKLSDFYLSVNSPEKQRQAMNKKNVSRKEPDILHEYCKQINSKQNENERSNDYFTMAEKFLSQTDESSLELRESSDGSSNNMSMRKLRNSSKCSKCFCRATKRTIEDCIICPTDDCMSYDSLEINDHLTDPDYVPETLSGSTEKSSSSVSESSLSLPDNVHLTESSISTSNTQQDSGTAASDSPVYVPVIAERNSRSRKNAEKSSPSVSESSLSLPDNALNKSNYLAKTSISASNTQQDSDNVVSDSQEDSPDNVPALVERKSNSYGSISTENVHLENNCPSESSKHTLETPEILSEGSTVCSNDGSQSKSLSSPETESDSCHTKISNLSKSCVSSVKVVINDVFKSAELVYLDPYVDCTLTQNQDVDITEKSAEKSTNHQHTTTSLLSQSAPLSDSNQLKNVEVDLDSDNSSIDDYNRRPEILTGTIKHLSGLNVDENNDASPNETDEQLVSTVTHSNDATNDATNVELVSKKSDVLISNNDENEAELVLENLNVEYSNDEDENEIKSISSDVENKIDNDPKVISNHSNVVSSNAEIDNQHVSKGSDVDDSEPELISNHSDIESNSDNDDEKLVPNYSEHADADDSDIEDGVELISNHSDVESSNAKIEDKHVSECSDDENSEPEFISNHSDVDSSNDDDDAKFISNYSDTDDSNNEDDTELISNHSDVEKGKDKVVYKSNILMESTKEIIRNESPNILFYSKVDSEIESKRCFVESNHEQQSDTQLDSNINSLQSNQDTSEKNTKLLDADQAGITKSDDEVLRKSSNPRRSRRVKSDVDVFMSNDESQRITKETELCFSPVKKKKSSQSEKSSIQSKENSSSVTAAATSCACSNNSATKKSRRQRNSKGGLSFTTTRLDFSPNKSGFQQPVRRAKMSIKKSSRVRTCTLRPDLTPRKFLVSANYNEDIELETILRPDLERISKTLANSSTVASNLSSELEDVSVEDIITTKCIPIIQIADEIPNAGIEIEQEPEYLLEKEKQPVVSLSKPSIENNLSMQSFILSDYTSSEEIASKVAHAERKTIRKGGRASRRRSSDDRVIIPIVDCSGNIFKQPSSTRELLDLTQPNFKESQEATNNMSYKETMYQCDFTIDSPYLKDNFSASKKSFNSNEESSVKAGDNQTNCKTNSNQTNMCGSSSPTVMEQPKPFGKNMAFRTEHMIVRDDNEKIPFIFQKHHIASQQSSKELMNSRAHLKSSNRGMQKEPLPGFDVECFSKYLSEPSINTSMMEELGCSPVVDLQKNQHSETKENRQKIFARKSIDILRASCLHVINDSEFISSEHKETSVSDLQNSEDPQFSSPPHKILLTENAASDFETTPTKSVTTVCDEVSDNSPKRKRFLKKIVRSMINDANVKEDGVKEQRILVERGKEHVPRKRFLYAKKL